MKLLTKELETKLKKQFPKGSSFEQEVVAKIFNPYGRATWYLMNQDPKDSDYLWGVAILFDDVGPEMGSISLKELESVEIFPGCGLERDKYFRPITVKELYRKLNNGEHV